MVSMKLELLNDFFFSKMKQNPFELFYVKISVKMIFFNRIVHRILISKYFQLEMISNSLFAELFEIVNDR